MDIAKAYDDYLSRLNYGESKDKAIKIAADCWGFSESHLRDYVDMMESLD